MKWSTNESLAAVLDGLPASWETARLGHEAWVRARLGWKGLTADEYVDDGYVFLSTPNIKSKDIDFDGANFITEERFLESPEIILRKGDVLLAKDGSIGVVNLVRDLPAPATVNGSIAVITPSERLVGGYLSYVLQSSYAQSLMRFLQGGMGVPHLFQWDINRMELPLPPVEAQRAITKFLDRETAQIDGMIEAQRELISRIDERRSAIITDLVSGGEGAGVPTSAPGSEWIGQVPEHWKIAQVRHLGALHTGTTPQGDESEVFSDDPADTAWVRPEDLGSRHVRGRGLREEGRRQLRCVPAGSVLICGIGATVSKVGQSERPVATNQQITAWVHDLDPAFAYYAMVAAKPGLLAATVGNTLPILNNQRLGGVPIPVPPVSEQVAIGSRLDDVTTVMDDMIEAANDAIALMRERRAALISAAVTGCLDPLTGKETTPAELLESP